VVQIRTHAQKYYQKLMKEHGADAAERAFVEGEQFAVDMGTRLAEPEVDAIFETYPEAKAAADRTERVWEQMITNGQASSRPDKEGNAAPRPPKRRRAPDARGAPGHPESIASRASSSRPKRQAAMRPFYRDEYLAGDEEEAEDDGGEADEAEDGALVNQTGGSFRYPHPGTAFGVPRGGRARQPSPQSSPVPPTPTTTNAALMLVQGKTRGNLARGHNTPRTLQAAEWLMKVTGEVVAEHASGMPPPSSGIALAGRRATSTGDDPVGFPLSGQVARPAPAPNPWGAAAVAQAHSLPPTDSSATPQAFTGIPSYATLPAPASDAPSAVLPIIDSREAEATLPPPPSHSPEP
jgi:hypothetical protein